jgi:hypothetical protein
VIRALVALGVVIGVVSLGLTISLGILEAEWRLRARRRDHRRGGEVDLTGIRSWPR